MHIAQLFAWRLDPSLFQGSTEGRVSHITKTAEQRLAEVRKRTRGHRWVAGLPKTELGMPLRA